MHIESLNIPDVKIIRPKKHGDNRGFFSETYNKKAFLEQFGIGLDFVQDNQSFSREKNTVRGLHYQTPPFAQDKLVRVLKGSILDVAVDIRKSSKTFGKWVAAEISAENWNQILVPIGFAHAFCTLEPDTEIFYKVTNYYSAANDFGLRWNDPDIGIDWPFSEAEAILSDKDKKQPFLKDATQLFD